MPNQYVDDTMEYIESDIEKIQMKTGMYISYVGERGALHLCKEGIQNAIDECANPKSPGKKIDVTLDTLEGSITIEDDGRGIPENDLPMEILCTKLNSGSKFTREQSGVSAGENGTGLTATNSLSSKFEWASYRGGEEHKLKFEEGKKVSDTKKKSKKEHGCILKFIPSIKYLGKTAKIPKKGLKEWMDSMSYFIPDKSSMSLTITKGFKVEETIKYKKRQLSEMLSNKITDTKLSESYYFTGNAKLKEDFRGERIIDRTLKLEFVFQYTDSLEPWVDSFCNYVNTTSGGTHLDSVKEAIWRYLMKKTNEILSDKEKEKYKVLKVDIENGLNLIVNVFTDAQMQFVGQTKDAVSSELLIEPIKNIATEALDKYFNENKTALAQITKIIKANCKARHDMTKIKAATIKEVDNKMDEFMLDNFTPCNNTGKAYKEIHICEGKSAKGSLVDGRDPDTQAFISFRGVPANGFKGDASTILDNKEWYEYVRRLKTNFGPKFNIKNCYYDKIIIETDSDIDGHGITSYVCTFHVLYMPEIITSGRLYKSVPPLYRIQTTGKNEKEFVRDKNEYVEIYQDKIIKNYHVCLGTGKKKEEMKKDLFKKFIYDTQEYQDELIRISKHFAVNKFLIERIAAFIALNCVKVNNDSIVLPNMDKLFENNKFKLELTEFIQLKYPEIKISGNNSLRGIVDGRFQSISINNRFLKKVEDILYVYIDYAYELSVKENNQKDYTVMSVGEFLDQANKYKPAIKTRYKGLGEMNSKQLWETTLNPDNRILIQLTMEDCEREMEIFQKLHGEGKRYSDMRKDMMKSYKINRNDLDN